MRKRSRARGVMCVAVLLALTGRLAQGQSFCRYEVTAIIQGPSCGIFGPTLVKLLNLNDLGQACGYYRSCSSSDNLPFVWSEETGFVALPLPTGATYGEANDINNVLGSDGLGQVACTLGFGPIGGNGDRAYLYDDGVWTELGSVSGFSQSRARALNDSCEVVGESATPNLCAFIWRNGAISAIDLPLGPNSSAQDVNAFSSIAGWMGQASTTFALGFLATAVGIEEIATVVGGNSSQANALNSSDVVVGQSRIPVVSGQISIRAWLYREGRLIPLPHPEEVNRTIAIDINDAVQIIVRLEDLNGGTGSYLWQQDEMIPIVDLVEPVPGVSFGGTIVTAINNKGQIGAVAHVLGATNAGIILTPIDRPLGDVNVDCEVNGEDLALVLGDWGPCPAVCSCICDIVTSSTFQPPPDGVVDGADLAVVLGNWTVRSDQSAANRRR